jgi:hypothetical protein
MAEWARVVPSVGVNIATRAASLGTPPLHVGFGKRAATWMSGEAVVALGTSTIQ